MRRQLAAAAIAGSALCLPSPAHAHMASTGLGPFYDGVAHLLISPMDALPIAALALLAGLRGPAWGRDVLLALPAASLAGSVAAAVRVVPSPSPVVAASLTVALGALVAADVLVSRRAAAAVAVVLGLALGAATGPALGAGSAAMLFVAGGATATFVAVALLAGLVVGLQATAARLAVRVAGSWIAAIALLTLGWALR